MSKISSVLDISKRALMNSQTALQTVSHNVASKNVEGYSRQRVELETTPTVRSGSLQFGTGARAKAVTRVVDSYMEKQIQNESGKLGTRQGEADNLARVENLFNEQMRKGLNHFVTEFFNAFRELSNSPDNQATRDLVTATASAVVTDLRNSNSQLKAIQEDIDSQIKAEISDANSMISTIALLNEKIENIEFTGANANDERDQRDQLLKDLGQKMNIRYTEGENGKVLVTAGNSGVIISGGEHAILDANSSEAHGNKREGNYDIFFRYEHTSPIRITEQITGGRIGGALKVRDEVVNGILDRLDDLAYTIAEKVNMAHEKGFNRYGETKKGFFIMPAEKREASGNIQINDEITDDPWKIAAAGAPNSPGDNRVANLISSLQYEKWMDEGNATFNDYYNGIVSEMAVKIRKANDMYTYQQNVVEQLKNLRENVSGVNLDEEMIKMIEHQKAFDASARMIRAADEMLDTIINLKR